jgi:hypothetical protein
VNYTNRKPIPNTLLIILGNIGEYLGREIVKNGEDVWSFLFIRPIDN